MNDALKRVARLRVFLHVVDRVVCPTQYVDWHPPSRWARAWGFL